VLSVLDVSGSMSTTDIHYAHPFRGRAGSDPMTCADVGAIFAAATYKASAEGGRAEVMTFDTEVEWETRKLHQGMSVYDIAQRINHQGGGTALHEPIKAALTSSKKFDVMVFITDSMSWADEMSGSSYWNRGRGESNSAAALRTYREKVNGDVRVFFVQLVPTSMQMTAPDTANTWYIAGWSNDVLNYIALNAETGTSQLAAIDAIEL
jgi:hypothetical protein